MGNISDMDTGDLRPSAEEREDIFVTTRWTLVQRAGGSAPDARAALEDICRTYWFPLYAYARRRGKSPEDAEDLTQAFFVRLLEQRWIEDANREKGQLRAFLITAMKRFMLKEWRKASAQKRGGSVNILSIDAELAEGRYAGSVTPSLDADALFDRQWALTVLNATFQRLETEFSRTAKSAEYSVLKESLVLTRESLNYADIAARLEISEGAARVAVHRLRKRFREVYRAEVAHTLPVGADVDEEARYLAVSLTKG